MREGIHPDYYQQLLHVTVEIHLLQDQQRKISTLRSVLNAIHSTQVSRKLTELMVVLISSTRNTVSTNRKKWLQIRLRLLNLNLF